MRADSFRWPDRGHLGEFLRLGLAVTLLFVCVYAGCDALTARRSFRVPVHLEAELGIPFVPQAAWVYVSIYGLFALLPLMLTTRAELRALARRLAVSTLLGGAGFLLFPAELAYPAPADPAGQPYVFRFADALNLEHNLAPSLHVALSVACAAAMTARAGRALRVALWGWAFAIAVSTLLTHQHHLLDVLTGGLLGLAVSRRLIVD